MTEERDLLEELWNRGDNRVMTRLESWRSRFGKFLHDVAVDRLIRREPCCYRCHAKGDGAWR